MNPSKLQPALLAGLAIGVLSSLPVVNIVNLCCCAWVVFGGALAAYLMQQNHPAPITTGDGALVGLMAGAIGAVVGSLVAIPLTMLMGPYQAQMFERMIENSGDMPPEVREMLEQWGSGMAGGAMMGIAFIFSLIFSLIVYSIFGLFGGLIGAAIFKSKTPPPPPPSEFGGSGGFNPPATWTPPPPPPPSQP
jgi:hypothetical protein